MYAIIIMSEEGAIEGIIGPIHKMALAQAYAEDHRIPTYRILPLQQPYPAVKPLEG